MTNENERKTPEQEQQGSRSGYGGPSKQAQSPGQDGQQVQKPNELKPTEQKPAQQK